MKLIKFIFVIGLAFFAQNSFASMTFDYTAPVIISTDVVPVCSTGDVFSVYDGTDTYVDTANCDDANTFTSAVVDTLTIVECDTSVPLADCNEGLLSDALLNTGYISNQEFEFIDYPVYECVTNDMVCYRDWLLFNLVFLFLLSSIVFTGYISALFKKKEK